MTDTTKYKYTNSLIKETSPYLLQHAHNPVDWHAWNKETLEKAIKENKPLLVSIGYAACHWCHVMEHESFEDEEVAELMNAHFICIKVDREERPDVDQFYMTAANLITGGGGWPLNCFAMPDGRVFHAGTYFRKQDWIRLLGSVSEEYEKNRDKLSEFADQVSQGIRQSQSIPFIEADQSFDTDVLHRSVLKWTQQFDAMNGGPNRAPKFPLPDNYLFLMQYAHQFANEQVWKHVEKTLHKMGDGGIFDQVGGGFCRYSVDEKWKVPHFEKMLYDNAQLISLYATAYKKTRNEYYLEIARKCADFCIRELCSEEGVFYSSLDADSEGEEGKFYTWSEQELVEVLGKDMELARLYFHIDSKGMWEDKYILMRKLDKEEIKDELRISEEQYQKKVNSMFESLGKARSNRVRPGLDDKSLTSWNALMITGLVDLYQASGDNEYLAQAKKTLRFLLGKQVEGNRIFHNYKEGKSTIPGFLEDYAFLVSAIIKMNEADPGSGDLDLADQLTQATIDSFYNRSDRTFQFTSVRSKELAVAPLEVMDNVIPSSMAVTVRNLRKMYLVTGHEEYETIALDLLHRVLPRVESYGSGFSHWMQEMMALVTSPKEVVVIGENAGERAIDLTMNYLPGTLVLTASGPSEQLIFKDRYQGDRTLIYVCTNRACRAPVEDPRQALVALR